MWFVLIRLPLLEFSSDSNDLANVETDCQLLQSCSTKYIEKIKSRIDLMQLFVSMFTDIPQSIPEDHVKLIEVNKFVIFLCFTNNQYYIQMILIYINIGTFIFFGHSRKRFFRIIWWIRDSVGKLDWIFMEKEVVSLCFLHLHV